MSNCLYWTFKCTGKLCFWVPEESFHSEVNASPYRRSTLSNILVTKLLRARPIFIDAVSTESDVFLTNILALQMTTTQCFYLASLFYLILFSHSGWKTIPKTHLRFGTVSNAETGRPSTEAIFIISSRWVGFLLHRGSGTFDVPLQQEGC